MNDNTPAPTARLLAWRCLCRWNKGRGTFADSLIHHVESKLKPPDRAMLQAIVLGTLRHLKLLDYMLAELRKKRHLQEDARWLLLSGLCQLFILKWPEYAVVNELAGLAPPQLRSLVNGVLREALRRRSQWETDLPKLAPSVLYSMPDWLVERWTARYGEKECLELLKWFSQPASVYLRVNPLNPPPNIPSTWEALAGLPGWYRLSGGGFPLQELRMGQVYAADPATRHCIDMLSPSIHEKILDTCAAPGGKSAAILAMTGGESDLVATDVDKKRVPMLESNLRKAAAGHPACVECHDWTQPCPTRFQRTFDAVLSDVPCSNSGVLQRRVDARWRINAEELTKLTETQFAIADHSMQAVKPGGRFVYSTCSIEPEENTEQVLRLLKKHPDWELVEEKLILPHKEHTDGAYCALLRAPLE